MKVRKLRLPRFLIVGLIVTSCSSTSSVNHPVASLEVPADFQARFERHHFQKDDAVTGRGDPFTASVPVTQYDGNWGPITSDPDKSHKWSIDVYAGLSSQILLVCAQAKDGYDAPFDESQDLFSPWPPELHKTMLVGYLCARFEHKHFRWGEAVSLLSQNVDDAHPPGFMNGPLRYKIWGVSKDHHFTVAASFAVTHPRLEGSETAPEDITKDPGYILIQSCAADEFQPSLTVIDHMIDSLDFH